MNPSLNLFVLDDNNRLSLITRIIKNNNGCFFNFKKNYGDDNWYLCSFRPINKKQQIIKNIEIWFVTFHPDIEREFVEHVVTKCYNLARNMSTENMPDFTDKAKKDLVDCIDRSFYKFSHVTDEKYNIISFVANIFFNLVIGHILGNGNKRFATATMIWLLYFFGYYFKGTRGKWINYEKIEDKVCDFVIKWQNRVVSNRDELVDEISEWILDNVVISRDRIIKSDEQSGQ